MRALENLKKSGEIKAVGAGTNMRGCVPLFLDRFDLDFFLISQVRVCDEN